MEIETHRMPASPEDSRRADAEAEKTGRPVSHQQRPVVAELRELRDIARNAHGPNARSTRRIEEALAEEEHEAAREASGKPHAPR